MPVQYGTETLCEELNIWRNFWFVGQTLEMELDLMSTIFYLLHCRKGYFWWDIEKCITDDVANVKEEIGVAAHDEGKGEKRKCPLEEGIFKKVLSLIAN